MKTKYIIIGIVATAFLVLAALSFNSSKIEYADFQIAKETGKTVQIIGKLSKENLINYNSDKNILTFTLIDEKNNIEQVIYNGSKPNNFDIAPMVVVKGRYEDGKFSASEILTKCPSKYEGKFQKNKSVGAN
jgi:cytochrome c-type biogenesis protein CcmE